MTRYSFLHLNLGPDARRRAQSMHAAIERGGADLIGVNECDTSARRAAYEHEAEGWHWWLPGADGFLWHERRVTIRARTSRRIMAGGWRRVGRVKRRRRLGPDRWARAARFDVDGQLVLHVQAHLMAKSFTTHRWRQPLWWASVLALRIYLGWLMRRNPGVPVVCTLDANTERDFSLGRYMSDVSGELDTYGRRDYDRAFVDNRGGVRLVSIRRVTFTSSDHKGLLLVIEL